jgi:hypothetical protein
MRTPFVLLLILTVPVVLSAAPRFNDVTNDSGIKVGNRAHAVAAEDFNGDGHLDFIVACFDAPHVQLFFGDGKLHFSERTKGSGLESFVGAGTGMAIGDYDRDGKLDVYIASLRAGSSRLFRGLGGGKFADVSQKSGTLVESACRSCSFSDVDGDGWLDLYVTAPHGPNHLFRNKHNGTFTDIAAIAGLAMSDRENLGCAFGDVDGDGRDDLFVTSYDSQASGLFMNLGKGKFREASDRAGLARRASSVGCTFGDVLNRGRLDLYVTTDSWMSGENATEQQLLNRGRTVEPNLLYLHSGGAKFHSASGGPSTYKSLAHDIVLEDLDHDGRVEIYVGVDAMSGNRFATNKGGNPLWTRTDGKTFVEAGTHWGVKHEANCVCVPAADFDADGDLDLLLINYYSNAVLLRNNTNDARWLKVKPVGRQSNLNAIGAVVRLFASDDGKSVLIGTRQVQSGAGYCRASPLVAHFGLGAKQAAAYRVEVFFPASRQTARVEDVQAGRRIEVAEPRPP